MPPAFLLGHACEPRIHILLRPKQWGFLMVFSAIRRGMNLAPKVTALCSSPCLEESLVLPTEPHWGRKTLSAWSCRGRRNWGRTGLDVTIFGAFCSWQAQSEGAQVPNTNAALHSSCTKGSLLQGS